MLVTRIAPTPSGFLHEGNAVNALLTGWLARSAGGRLLLRIDDFDTGRVREEYLADVFDLLAWLGVAPDEGPSDPAEFERRWSMAGRTEEFRGAAHRLRAAHPEVVFACGCSRRDLVAGRCVRGCADRDLALAPGHTVLRLRVATGTLVTASTSAPAAVRSPAVDGPPELGAHLAGAAAAPPAGHLAVPAGDHVLWRRDDLPAYQLGSVLADEALGVTSLVRGEDLRDSTALQLHLAALLPARGFQRVDARHHALLAGPDGHKLSKSAGARAHPMPRTEALRQQVHDWACELGAAIGITEP
ncbi:MAG TPA: glutamate--tRNA ligase family protein [Candidatus Nanopelagicales bacterium]